ncbi:uncharacterized protein LOC117581568 isoform X2 [Drosophila guanche]|uniref:uncharacterized protein LOC117581568 isoform X2 n=1 Tax=Drosophila guanche TaxID=7266 RepID=UPI0014717533|nr:uncharacterized protein LOC117581568 isoform X2 [Drosophila guanche]
MKKKAKASPKGNNFTQPKERTNQQNSDKKSTPEKPSVWRSNFKAKTNEGLQAVSVAERSSLKGWVTSVLGDGVTQADMGLRSCVVFCQLIAQIYPGSIDTSNIKLKARMVHERAHNIALLKKALKQQETGMKEAEVTKRLNGSSNDLFEFLKCLQEIHVAIVPPRPPAVVAAPPKKQPPKEPLPETKREPTACDLSATKQEMDVHVAIVPPPPKKQPPKKPLASIAPKKKTQVRKETKEKPTACDLSATVDSSALTYAMPQEEEEEAVPAPKPEDHTPKPGVSMLQKLFNCQGFKRALADHLSVLDESSSDDDEIEYTQERIDRIAQGFFGIIVVCIYVMRDEIKASGGARTEKDIVLEFIGDIRRMRIDVKEHNRDGTPKTLYELKHAFFSAFQRFVDIYQITADIITVPEVMTVEVMPVHRHPRFKFNKRNRHWFPEYHPETMLNGESQEHLPMLAKGQTLQEMLQQWNMTHGIKQETEAEKEPQPGADTIDEVQLVPEQTSVPQSVHVVPCEEEQQETEFPQLGVVQDEERTMNPCEMEEPETGQKMPKMPQPEMMPEAISWPFEEFPQFGVAPKENREMNPFEMEEQETAKEMPKIVPEAISWTFEEFPQFGVAPKENREMNPFEMEEQETAKEMPKIVPEAISWPFEEFPQFGVAPMEEREMNQTQKELKEVEREASPAAFDEPQSELIFPTAETDPHSGIESLTFGLFENDEQGSLLETEAGQRPATPEMAQSLMMPDCGQMVARKVPRQREVKAATAQELMMLLGGDDTLVRKNPVAPQETTSPERNLVTEQFVWKTPPKRKTGSPLPLPLPPPTMMTLRAAVNLSIDFPEEDFDRLVMVVPLDESQIEGQPEQLSTDEQLESSPDLQQLEPQESTD